LELAQARHVARLAAGVTVPPVAGAAELLVVEVMVQVKRLVLAALNCDHSSHNIVHYRGSERHNRGNA
jgi:hypothetical protein